MAGDTVQTRGTRHSSRVHEVKMENEGETPRTLGFHSRAQTPRTGKGNNRYGNKGTEKCYSCRHLKRKCTFTDPEKPCERCVAKKLGCSAKLKAEDQQLLKTPPDYKQPLSQPQWPADEPLLPRIFEATASTMDPLAIIEKLQVELNELIFELSGKLPAPQVQVDSLPQFYYNEPYNQSYQQVVNQYSIAPLIQAPSFYEQSPPSYTNGAAPLPNSFAPFTPNSMTAPAPADLHRQFPRLTTPRTQSLDHLASDSQSFWNSTDGTYLAPFTEAFTSARRDHLELISPQAQDTEMVSPSLPS